MLNEDLLVGPGRQARDTLRPLAYSTLADLVHHVKDRIDLDQVSRVIQVCFALVSSAGEHVYGYVLLLCSLNVFCLACWILLFSSEGRDSMERRV